MESIKRILFIGGIFLFSIVFFNDTQIKAQDEPVVIDEVIAQVNEGVITLSRIKRETKNAIDSMVANGKAEAQARKEIEEKQSEIIASLINEELMLQKGKELELDKSVEAEVNQRFLTIMRQQKIKTLEELFAKMRESGINPEEIRDNLTRQIMNDSVLQRDVDAKIYYGLSSKEIKDYFEKNKDKFKKLESVTLSQIFLSFAGRDTDAVKTKAAELIVKAKSGTDFGKLAIENSDEPDVAQSKGVVGTFAVAELADEIAEKIKNLKQGEITQLASDEQGIRILKVDKRENAGNEGVFDENKIRMAITNERIPEARKKYMIELRKEAYIKISDTYRPLVAPILFQDERTKTTTTTTKKGN